MTQANTDRNNAPATADQREARPERIAQLVAEGAIPFPMGLAAHENTELAARVRQLRIGRLVLHIARSIALDVSREQEERFDDPTNL